MDLQNRGRIHSNRECRRRFRPAQEDRDDPDKFSPCIRTPNLILPHLETYAGRMADHRRTKPPLARCPIRTRFCGRVGVALPFVVALAFLSVIPSGNLLLPLPLPLPFPPPRAGCPIRSQRQRRDLYQPGATPQVSRRRNDQIALLHASTPPTDTHAKPLAVRAGPVKPPQPPKTTKTRINTGDLYFQNLA